MHFFFAKFSQSTDGEIICRQIFATYSIYNHRNSFVTVCKSKEQLLALQWLFNYYYRNFPRSLRTSGQELLTLPLAKLKTYGDRAFSTAAPRLWNNLPLNIRKSASEDIFKKNLKTYLFKEAYDT